jgi:hypothetical protein
MKINEADKPKHGGDKYQVINLIIVHTHVQKTAVVEMLYTRTCNISATTMAPVSIQISPPSLEALSRSPVDTPSLKTPATCDAGAHMISIQQPVAQYDTHIFYNTATFCTYLKENV